MTDKLREHTIEKKKQNMTWQDKNIWSEMWLDKKLQHRKNIKT